MVIESAEGSLREEYPLSTRFTTCSSRKSLLSAAAIFSCGLASSSAESATFEGFVGVPSIVEVDGVSYSVIDLYAQFAEPSVHVVNGFDATLFNSHGSSFVHSDLNTIVGSPGTWSPAASVAVAGALPAIDSFVTVGGSPGSANTTALDPNLSPPDASVPPPGSGWYNSNPGNLQGLNDPISRRTLLGRFVIVSPVSSESLEFVGSITFGDYVNGSNGDAMQTTGIASIPYLISCDTLDAAASATDFGSEGGSGSVTVDVASVDCQWSAASDSDWLTVTGGSGSGDGGFSFAVAANIVGGSRSGQIVVSNGAASEVAIVVTQAGALACSFASSPSARTVSFIGSLYGSTFSFEVLSSDTGCEWTAVPAAGSGWLELVGDSSGSGDGQVTYSVSPNFFLPTRTGVIEVRSGGDVVATHTVVQAQPAAECTGAVEFAASTVAIGAETSEGVVGVSTEGVLCAWYASTPDSWITISNGGSFTGDGEVVFVVSANTGAARSGTISIGSGSALRSVTIEQAAVCGALAVSPSVRQVSFLGSLYGDTFGFSVDDGGEGCEWTLDVDAGSPPWIALSGSDSGTGSGAVGYTVDINLFAMSRTGSIRVLVFGEVVATHTVVQAGPAVECTQPVTFTPSSATVGASGGSLEIAVSTNGAVCAWYADSSDSWISITDGDAFTGDGTMRVAVSPNEDSSSRTGAITVGNGSGLSTFSISQAGSGGTSCDILSANASSTSIPSSGTSSPVSVSVTVGGSVCGWSAISDAVWLSVSPGTGSGSGAFSFTATANGTSSPRSGTITVVSGTAAPVSIVVVQEGISCGSLEAVASSTTVPASGTPSPVSVSVTVGGSVCGWSAISDAVWLSVSPGTGSGSGAFSFTAEENFSTSSRTAVVTVSSGTASPVLISVTQVGYELCESAESLAPSTSSATAASGVGSVAISTPTLTCAWEATVTVGSDWLSIVSGGSGLGSGTLTYAFAENLSDASRVGVITLTGGGTFTLTQSGAGTPCAPWTPADLPSLRAWYDAADASTVTVSGGRVSEWADKSGSGFDVTSTGNDRPTYTPGGLASQNVMSFDGSNRLSASTPGDWRFLHDATGSTVAMVTRAGTTGGSSRMGLVWTNPFSSVNVGLCLTQNFGGIFYALVSRGGGQWVLLNQSSSNSWPAGSTAVLTHVGDPGNPIAAARSVSRINGGPPMAFNSRTAAPSTADPDFALQIGASGFSSMAGLNGIMAEVVICDTDLPDAARTKLEGYLAWKWGLESELPETHPYRNAAPTVGDCASGLLATPEMTLVPAPGVSEPIQVSVSSPDGTPPAWTASASASWISIQSGSSAGDPNGFGFTASANYGMLPRTASVTVLGEDGSSASFEVVQQAPCEQAGGDDCDGDGVADLCAILWEQVEDANANLLPDGCERSFGDVNLDGIVDGADLSIVLGSWGEVEPGSSGEIADATLDGIVDGADLAVILANWGQSPEV